jgi:NADPH:quinone reductase-like Zn-dependent oxidoreductase
MADVGVPMEQSASSATPGTKRMNAMVYTHHGTPDVLHLQEIAIPIPKDDEVLIRVHATSVNSGDWELLRGTPSLFTLGGRLKPRFKILGADVAGRVEAVGSAATQFKPGDEVFGDVFESGCGGFAEYVCARETALVSKPASMTFEQAAALPQAGTLALQGLRDRGHVQSGQKVLVNGAGGGMGTFAVQLAKSFGAEVTGVDSTGKLDMMSSIGADHVIDYTHENFTQTGQRYDLILDAVAKRSISSYKRALLPEGVFVMVGGSMALLFKVLLLGPLISMAGRKKIRVLWWKPKSSDLIALRELFEAGKIVPVIDRCYPLVELAKALQRIGDGNAQGKIVITMKDENKT